jgi:hypothetical protein
VGPHPLLADPDCVVCGHLAHIPASSRVPPALPYHHGPPASGRAESPVLPRPAAGDRQPAKMLIRSSSSTRPMALACGITASPDPGQPSPPGTDHTDPNAHRRHVMSQLAAPDRWLRGRIAWFAVHLMIKVLSSAPPGGSEYLCVTDGAVNVRSAAAGALRLGSTSAGGAGELVPRLITFACFPSGATPRPEPLFCA